MNRSSPFFPGIFRGFCIVRFRENRFPASDKRKRFLASSHKHSLHFQENTYSTRLAPLLLLQLRVNILMGGGGIMANLAEDLRYGFRYFCHHHRDRIGIVVGVRDQQDSPQRTAGDRDIGSCSVFFSRYPFIFRGPGGLLSACPPGHSSGACDSSAAGIKKLKSRHALRAGAGVEPAPCAVVSPIERHMPVLCFSLLFAFSHGSHSQSRSSYGNLP